MRGIYPTDVNIESVSVVAHALAYLLNPGVVIVARDGRHGGEELSKTLEEKLIYFGESFNKKFEIISVGLSTTPMFYFLVNHFKASGGAMVTASHNPKEYSGIKAVKELAIPFSGTELLKTIEENFQ